MLCVVTSDLGLLFETEVTHPYAWSVFVCVFRRPGFDSTSPAFVRSRASEAAGSDGRFAKKMESGPPSLGAGVV